MADMLNNYYTLLRLVHEFRGRLLATKIFHAVTKKKSTIEIYFEDARGGITALVCSCSPRENFLYALYRGAPKPKGANVLPEIVGKTVDSIAVAVSDRKIVLRFSDSSCLVFLLFGSSANIHYVDGDGMVINSFLRPHDHVGKKIELNLSGVPFPTSADEVRECAGGPEGELARRLSKRVPTFDSTLARETLFRYEAVIERGQSESSDQKSTGKMISLERLFEILTEIKNELDNPSPRIYMRDGKAVSFALIRLKHLTMTEFREYDSVNECVRDFVLIHERDATFMDARKDIVGKLARRIETYKRTISKIDSDIYSNRWTRHQAAAEYLMANHNSIRKGTKEVRITIADGDFTVSLDPSLTPIQNAQIFFTKAKQAKTSVEQSVLRKVELSEKIRGDEILLREANEAGDLNNLESLAKRNPTEAGEKNPFRLFEKYGFMIYVGKNAKNNDELTFGFAKPNDVFLHARGASGSHVIIRNSSRDYPQKPVIKYAASIAAHYSKARSSGVVPVAYTMRKFVKKARGIPGAVLLDREEVIFVKPEIPS